MQLEIVRAFRNPVSSPKKYEMLVAALTEAINEMAADIVEHDADYEKFLEERRKDKKNE